MSYRIHETRAWASVALALALVAPSGGCQRQGESYDARRVAHFERNLVSLAARDSRCSASDVHLVQMGDRTWAANTCSGPREYFLDCGGRQHLRGRCRWRRVSTVSDATATVLGCPSMAIGQEVGSTPTTRYAEGCGRRVQVSLQCNTRGCAWVADGPPTRARPSGAAQRIAVVPAR